MDIARLASIPIDHIIAELAAFPIASTAAFGKGMVSLSPMLDGKTGDLWRQTEKYLLRAFPALSVDEMVSIRDKIWFHQAGTGPIGLQTYLVHVAKMYLEPVGSVAIPRLPRTNEFDLEEQSANTSIVRRSWRWLSLAIPTDLLLAALWEAGHGPDSIDLISPRLARLLKESGFAEIHLHVGAALDFPIMWNCLMHSIAEPDIKAGAFKSPGAEFDEGLKFGHWLIRAAIARYVLTAYLFSSRNFKSFSDFLFRDFKFRLVRWSPISNFTLLLKAFKELTDGRIRGPAFDYANLQSLYRIMIGASEIHPRKPPAHSVEWDPILPLITQQRISGLSPENYFVTKSLSYLKGEGANDRNFGVLFWQIIRLRSLFYRHIVHRPMTPGLQWFIRFYGRMKPAKTSIDERSLFQTALRTGGLGQGLRSLEIRTSPDESISDVQRYLNNLDKTAQSLCGNEPTANVGSVPTGTGCEIGLVYHFAKTRGGGAIEGRPNAYWRGSYADPLSMKKSKSRNLTGFRYAGFYREKLKEALAFEWILRHRPISLELIRGVDVCTDELGVPNWVLKPLLNRIRNAAYDCGSFLKRFYGIEPLLLRTTAHVGEDFVHLLTGLRNVHEAIEFFQLREGDRIGHGISLGVDPLQWASRMGQVPLMIEERLLDLAWEWEFYGRERDCSNPVRQNTIQYEIAKLSDVVFGFQIEPYTLTKLRKDLYDPWKLYQIGFPDKPLDKKKLSPRLARLSTYLTDAAVFARGRKIIWLRTDKEGEALAWIQARLRQKIGSIGISVEINPSSNLLIGDLSDLTSHPLWRLNSPRRDGDAPPVSLCIGSDDPILFNSNIRREYQYLVDAMIIAGLSEDEAYRWINEARTCGLTSRFTIPRRLPGGILSVFNTKMPLNRSPI